MAAFRYSFRTVLMAGACLMATPALAQQAPAQDEASRLDDIVVTASTRAQTVERAPASISVVTSEQLENRAYVDLFDAVRDVEGVSVSGGSNFQDILIRGLPGAYTLTLVDGRRQSTREARVNGNGGLEQSFMPPVGAIERIEVVRGPMSSLYGSDALGGVINIITKKVPLRWGGLIGADYVSQENGDSGDWSQGQFYLGGPIVSETLGLQFWGRTFQRDEDDIYNGPSSTGSMGSDEYNLTGRLSWTPNADHEIMLTADTARIERSSSAGLTVAPTGRSVRNDHSRDSVSLAWNGNWNWGTSALSVMREEAQRETWTADTTGTLVLGLRAPEITNTVYDALFNVPLEGTALGDHNLVFGGQFLDSSLVDVNPGDRTNVAKTFGVWQRALFAEDEISLTDDLALTLGLRWDDHERYGNHWSPRAYLVWSASDALTLKGGVSTGFKAPELRAVAEGYAYETGGANCNYGAGLCGVIIGDPNLKPETSTNYEINVLWRPSPTLSLNATVFRTDFTDKIDSDRACGPDVNNNGVCDVPGEVLRWSVDPLYQLYYWYNVSDARIQGVELGGAWDATETLRLKANYTFTDSEQRGGLYAGQPLGRTPRHMANARVDYALTETLGLWGSVTYRGEEINAGLRVGTNGQPVLEGPRQVGRRYPDYTLVDIGANWRVRQNVSLKAGVYNLTDKVLDVATYDQQGDGRRFWVGANLEF
ncbi:TonB-dependent receptor domain-containing protein [Brevundimonas sp.]|uniref:TonB-dependent receptor domain-containing protein n=1 Tax=Brevundimonas sp. TaxID=1871086 RepID=UPI0025C1B9B8|nr:TonB-dependent receptor [Brevundimonas sp.]